MISPLAETAGRLSSLVEYLEYLVGVPDGEEWHRASALTDPDLVAAWLGEGTARIGDRRVAAAYMSNWLLSALASAWLLPVLADRRLPLAGLNAVAVRRSEEGWFNGVALANDAVALLPFDPLEPCPAAVTLPDLDALFDALAERLLALETIIDALRAACPLGYPALWGFLADGVSGQAHQLSEMIGRDSRETWRDANAVIERLTARQSRLRVSPRPFPVSHREGVEMFTVRGTCCLYYRTVEEPDRDGEGYCNTCPLRSDESRVIRLRAYLDSRREHHDD